jgi:DNA ligase (NAD+)
MNADWLDMRQALPEKQANSVREFFAVAEHRQIAEAAEQQLRDFGMHWPARRKSSKACRCPADLGVDRRSS